MFSNYINEINNKNRFSDIIKFVKYNKSLNNYNKNEIINYLTKLKQHKTISFCNDGLLEEIIYIFSNDSNEKLMFTEFLNISQYMYRYNLVSENNELERNNYLELFKLVINYYISIKKIQDNKDFKITNIEYISDIYNFFENKNNAKMIITKIIQNQIESNTILKAIYSCMSKTYSYYTDEFTYTRIMFNIIDELSSLDVDNLKKIDDYIHNQLNLAQKQAGIYDVDEEKIKELEDKANKLEKKLKDLKKSADQNSDSYRQIEEETKKILDDISKVRRREVHKTFKIIDINEENERKRLLKKIRRCNSHFEFEITDTRWFCKDVIEKIGIEYIANHCNYRSQQTINIAYQNNQIDALSQVFKLNPNFELYNSNLLTKENIELFGIDTIVKVFNDSEMQQILSNLYKKQGASLLKQILEVNPNFKISYSLANYIDKKLIEQLTTDYIANCSQSQQNTIVYFYSSNELSKLADILKIKPNFYIDDEELRHKVDFYRTHWIKSEIDILIKNFSVSELIEFFDLDSLNLCNLHFLLYKLMESTQNFELVETITEFANLDPIYRKKALAMKLDKYDSKFIAILYKNLVKKNNKLKEKVLVKK